jgi:hypothetical protein
MLLRKSALIQVGVMRLGMWASPSSHCCFPSAAAAAARHQPCCQQRCLQSSTTIDHALRCTTPCKTVVTCCTATIAERTKEAFNLEAVLASPDQYNFPGNVPSSHEQAAEAEARRRSIPSSAASPPTPSPASSSDGSGLDHGWQLGRHAGEALQLMPAAALPCALADAFIWLCEAADAL